ncbi:MAG: hypothetical protein II822_01225 [Prevotella sp.]|nr:hypothetical protein [Prevotella sp.]
MANYAIYAYKFIRCNDPGDWTQGAQVVETDMTHVQNTFYELFGKQSTLFHVQRDEGAGAKKYTCEVYGNDARVVALRLFNMKEEHYWQLVDSRTDPMGAVEKKSLPSTPCTFVIIDCRPDKNIIAVKVEKEAWSNTDSVRDLMEESINRHLESLSRGFRVKLYTKMESRNFFEYSKRRIIKEGRTVKHMTIRFKTGQLNPVIQARINTSVYLRYLFNVINKYALSGEMTLNQPIGPKLIDKRRHDIENIIALILSDPKGYGLDLTFDDKVTLHCGEDVRAELPMDPEGALDLFHIGRKAEQGTQQELFDDGSSKPVKNRYLLEGWLDEVAEQTKKMKDAETIKRRGSRSNRRKAS